jgi:hypothetical protein
MMLIPFGLNLRRPTLTLPLARMETFGVRQFQLEFCQGIPRRDTHRSDSLADVGCDRENEELSNLISD